MSDIPPEFHEQFNALWNRLTDNKMHELQSQVERLTRERDEARAEVAMLLAEEDTEVSVAMCGDAVVYKASDAN